MSDYSATTSRGAMSVKVDRERVLNAQEDAILVHIRAALVLSLPEERIGADKADVTRDLVCRAEVQRQDFPFVLVIVGQVTLDDAVARNERELQPPHERGDGERREEGLS